MYMYTYKYVCIYVYINMYVHMCLYIYGYTYPYIYMDIYVCIYILSENSQKSLHILKLKKIIMIMINDNGKVLIIGVQSNGDDHRD